LRRDRDAVLRQIAGRRVVVSVSGGKDSAAVALFLQELQIPYESVFADTGWEHPATYAYIRGPLARAIGTIHFVRGDVPFAGLVRSKRLFPDRTKRFCTTELKVKPILAFIEAMDEDVVNVIGIRGDESPTRAKAPEWEDSRALGVEVWRPILRWMKADVIDIHRRHGLSPNPLYALGAKRVGCWPCIHARQSEIVLVADTDPGRIDEIRALEEAVNAAAAANAEEKGEALRHKRAMFSLRESAWTPDGERMPTEVELDDGAAPGVPIQVLRRHHRAMPIDEAVEWARRGVSRRAPEGPAVSCGEWGFCE
jgi:3'-phosphoadenosine 5'-phosphosulfate sulfotransferase (PAPS reductase)/FAD synthetase